MYKILHKADLAPQITLMEVDAPLIAQKAQPGQFIILRTDKDGERIPLTVADYDKDKGTVTIIFQKIGKTTAKLGLLNEGEYILDFVGPLGVPSHLKGYSKACVIGGGLGCAIAYPQAKKLFELGASVDIIAGFKSRNMIILEDEMKAVSKRFHVCTDDGSYGAKGFVTDELLDLLNGGMKYDLVLTIGPLMMMKNICNLTRKFGVKTIVSMNPIMIDGTGMCGGCRLTVDGQTKFACVDGPDFDGHLVDFDETIKRSGMYKIHERDAMCNLLKEVGENA